MSGVRARATRTAPCPHSGTLNDNTITWASPPHRHLTGGILIEEERDAGRGTRETSRSVRPVLRSIASGSTADLTVDQAAARHAPGAVEALYQGDEKVRDALAHRCASATGRFCVRALRVRHHQRSSSDVAGARRLPSSRWHAARYQSRARNRCGGSSTRTAHCRMLRSRSACRCRNEYKSVVEGVVARYRSKCVPGLDHADRMPVGEVPHGDGAACRTGVEVATPA